MQIDSNLSHKALTVFSAKPLAKYCLKDEDEYETGLYDLSFSHHRTKFLNPCSRIYQAHHPNQPTLKQLAS
jgi:hypothetical protein